ncbi:MAG: L,D-transpeptidase [Microthrixaceae bacterium]
MPYSAAAHQGIAAMPREGYSITGRVKTPTGWQFDSKSPFGSPFSMLVTERRGYWAEVLIPVRPNGTRGYVDTRKVRLTRQDHIVQVDLSDRKLVAWQGTRKILETPVTIGSASRSTPTGRFYVTDRSNSTPGPAYGSHILALNGYSEKLDYFDGGVPVIALHGTDRPDLMGQAASNGCVRMPNEVVKVLYDWLPVGTMVEITA